MIPRRAYLHATALAGGALLAGCLDDGGESDGGGDDDGGDDGSDGGSAGDDGDEPDGGDGSNDGLDDGGGSGAAGGEDGGDSDASDGTGDGGDTTAETGANGDAGPPTPEGNVGQSEYPDYNWELLDGEDPVETETVTSTGFAFDPIVARVSAGEPITFDNQDSAPHTVTAPAIDVDEHLDGGETTTITFEEPGAYDYVCTFHAPDMLGRLVVE